MSLLNHSPKLCLRLGPRVLPPRPATQLCRAAASRAFATSPRLRRGGAPPKPPKRPGFLSRIRWYKDTDASRGPAAGPGEVLTMYEELPPTYRDRDGLPFAKADLTPAEVAKSLGHQIKPEFANALLRIMHGRRVAGTLEDPAYRANTARFTAAQREAALRYLRAAVPVDETINTGLRAQDELEQLEREMSEIKETADQPSPDRAPASASVPSSSSPAQGEVEARPAEEAIPHNPIYGIGVLDRIRARNLARIRAEEKRLEEEHQSQGEGVGGTLEAYIDRGAVSPQMQKWQEAGASSKLEEPPPMSAFDRVAPSAAFAGLLVAACLGLAVLYSPPEPHDRIFPEISPELATVATLIGLNLVVYALWKVPPMWRFMNRNFMLVVGMPRPVTVLTAVFSHQKLTHLAVNMVVLYYVGSRLHGDVGRANFLALYLSTGVTGYVAGLVLHGLHVGSLGASGAVLGITAAYFYLHMWDKFRILGFPAPPAEGVHGAAFLASVVLWNLVAALMPARLAQADMVSHVIGLTSGIGMVHLLRDVLDTIGKWQRSAGLGSEPESGDDAGSETTRGTDPAREVVAKPQMKHFDLWGSKHGD